MTSLVDLQTTLKLLSEPIRLRMLALLSMEELAVQELVTITGLAQSRVSNHLSLLKRAGLVLDRREGTWSFHRLAQPDSAAGLSPELFAAVLRPYLEGPEGQGDLRAVESVREQRRERSRRTHDALADRWSEVGEEFAEGSLRAEAFSSLVPKNLVIADLGCGAGFLTSFLVERGARVIAVDHSEKMLARAGMSLDSERVEFRSGEMEQLPLEAGEVDAAFANLVWHHLADMDRAARELQRILRPGGQAVITDLLPHDQDWMREEMGDLHLGIAPSRVEGALRRAGLQAVTHRKLQDSYLVEGRSGAKTKLPMFLACGSRPGAGTEI